MRDVRGVLLDIDGTLLSGDRAIPGAAELLAALEAAGTPYRLVTNTTRRSRVTIRRVLADAGLDVAADRILAPSVLARRRILDSGRTRALLLVAPASLEDFEGVDADDDRPDWVVVGDLGRGFTWERLNRAFLRLLDGARLLALQKNRYWHVGESGLAIDAGPFVAALEYAAAVEAEIVGKPSRAFFALALADLGVEPSRAVMVGDDLAADGGGALAAGCRAVLVRTGKFRPEDLERAGAPEPTATIDSIADLAGLLG